MLDLLHNSLIKASYPILVTEVLLGRTFSSKYFSRQFPANASANESIVWSLMGLLPRYSISKAELGFWKTFEMSANPWPESSTQTALRDSSLRRLLLASASVSAASTSLVNKYHPDVAHPK